MLSQSWAAALLLLSFTAPAACQTPPSLIEALVANNASQFADFIQADPEVLQLFLSSAGTVYAPVDKPSTQARSLAERALSPAEAAEAKSQGSKVQTKLNEDSQTQPGAVKQTLNKSPLVDGRNQSVVVDTRPANSTTQTKRWVGRSLAPRDGDCDEPNPNSLLRIASGLGKIANVIKADIAFQGGVIHITDKYFTPPQALSSSARATGQTAFANLAAAGNVTSTLETTHSITVFLPSNNAIAAGANATAGVSAAALVTGHVVAGRVAYLPDLADGDTLTTQTGEKLTVTVRPGGLYYVNGARITQANIVLENGVAHVIDKVLTPATTAAPPPVTGGSGALSQTLGLGVAVGVAVSALLALA
ncbi:FAS1 domain-containing protein [Lasiosphaeria miniovina]|uniref:FAS1 domain-containing protein n=1 Tax=Lasiosphaeria miniovina TaxID=1954250 RepID=A0AA40DK85_9PEZI|nr:FAS1 domain-containing protein [Lasiosphaeria miniovina]KAK0703882.1 FAS1 domain-containing protein [Lasiosphaeria miniovina]